MPGHDFSILTFHPNTHSPANVSVILPDGSFVLRQSFPLWVFLPSCLPVLPCSPLLFSPRVPAVCGFQHVQDMLQWHGGVNLWALSGDKPGRGELLECISPTRLTEPIIALRARRESRPVTVNVGWDVLRDRRATGWSAGDQLVAWVRPHLTSRQL